MNPDSKPNEFTQAQAHEMWDKINELKNVIEYDRASLREVRRESKNLQVENSKLSHDKCVIEKRCRGLERVIADLLLEASES